MSDPVKYLDENRDRYRDELFEFLRIPSISTDPAYKADVKRAGEWTRDQLTSAGLSAELVETEGHPIVFAESPEVPGKPSVLVYGHYDVQPVDPLDEWETPPFEPNERDGNVFARGATDDKGQMLTHVKSVEAWMKSVGSLPVQVKFLIEGEEECGSGALGPFIDEWLERLKCDVAVISDTCQFAPGQPAITYGLKGIAYYELYLTGPSQDLHSGSFGGAVSNPVNALSRMLAGIIDENGKVQIEGFYDDVIPVSDREQRQFAALPFDERTFMSQIGVDELHGEQGYTTLERRWVRPTYDINGVWGGYQGEGNKTVLPAKAGAKFSFRLVPDQDPKQITAGLRAYLADACPDGIKMELHERHGAPGVVVSLDSPYMTSAAKSIELGFGRPPVFIREGGSIPVVTQFKEKLGVDTLLLGWGLNDDNAHSPNEKFCLADYHRGIKASTHLWSELSKIKSEKA